MNLYAKTYKRYKDKGLVVLPDRYGSKAALLKGWQTFFNDKPTAEQYQEWTKLPKANISLLLGEASGVVALDLDTDKPEIMEVIGHLLPTSPVTKRGAKGYTAFFKYRGDFSEVLKFNGEVILEILSEGKKTTLPPSLHPNGANYVWDGESLENCNIEDLPVLPPALISHLTSVLQQKFGSVEAYGKVVSGRNNELSSYVGNLLNEDLTIDEAVTKLIAHDKKINDIPYFTDPNEFQCTDALTNAVYFFSTHIQSINSKRYRDSKEYVSPKTLKGTPPVGKSLAPQKKEGQKRCPTEFLLANTALKKVYETILKNSHIPQPELALGATLALFATLSSRKYMFRGMSSNMYICNISESGTGKDAPQQLIKHWLGECGGDTLVGAGDYVSDASLMDSLPLRPTRLDVLDEVGGLFKTMTRGGEGYASKMSDILTELYTSSSSYYTGRALANNIKGEEVVKGRCYRPNVNLLGSTTPTGFSEGVSSKSLDKGLLGRFIFFRGDPNTPSQEIKSRTDLDISTQNHIRFLTSVKPSESTFSLKGVLQSVIELDATPEANTRLSTAFQEFDAMRLKAVKTKYAPIMSRLYQLLLKFCIISATSRGDREVKSIDIQDVTFAYELTKFYLGSITKILSPLLYDSKRERDKIEIAMVIKQNTPCTIKDVIKKTPSLSPSYRKDILDELNICDIIISTTEKDDGKLTNFFYYRGENNE